jgi:hypothetical protein
MEIIKAKITKENTLEAVFKNENEDTVTIEGKNIIHKDMRAAFDDLIPHLAFLCEQKEADKKESLDELPDTVSTTFEVSGYSIGGSDDNEGTTLTGKRFLKSKKVLNLNAPFTMFNNENEEYPFAFELQQAIEACNYEVNQYLTAKKWAIVQQELPFQNEESSSEDNPFPDKVDDLNVDALADLCEQTGTTIKINGKQIKTRRTHKKCEKTVA